VRKMLVVSANHYTDADGTASTFMMPGYQVGAKTGTSSIPENGGYSSDVIGSVVGLAPADAPRYAILVKIDRPQDDIWGVVTALPVYEAIIEQLLRYERIAPDPSLVGPGQVAGVAFRNGQ
jgi:cell division protein FtsI (penicillin-binding protein 3)